MDNLLTIAILLLFEVNIIFPLGSGTVHALYLLPRFAGYLLLLMGCKTLDTFACFQRRKGFFAVMTIFEFVRWLGALFLYGAVELVCWQLPVWPILSALSICGMLYTVRILSETLAAVETKTEIDLNVRSLQKSWYCLLAFSILSILAMALPAAYIALWVLSAAVAIWYCVLLLRCKKTLFSRLPRDLLDAYR